MPDTIQPSGERCPLRSPYTVLCGPIGRSAETVFEVNWLDPLLHSSTALSTYSTRRQTTHPHRQEPLTDLAVSNFALEAHEDAQLHHVMCRVCPGRFPRSNGPTG